MQDEKSDARSERPVDRFDRKLGMAWSRVGGTICALIGGAMALSALSADDIPAHWPLFLGAAVFFILARSCFRSQTPISDLLTDGPASQDKK